MVDKGMIVQQSRANVAAIHAGRPFSYLPKENLRSWVRTIIIAQRRASDSVSL